jgi:serine/threonine protein kinase
MEFCDKTLEEIIHEFKNYANFRKDSLLMRVYFYIASSLFIEIVKGVQYLHENNIIHEG